MTPPLDESDRVVCAGCGSTTPRLKVAVGQVWRSRRLEFQGGRRGPSVRILAVDLDGPSIEQLGREDDGRMGMSYRELVQRYEPVAS